MTSAIRKIPSRRVAPPGMAVRACIRAEMYLGRSKAIALAAKEAPEQGDRHHRDSRCEAVVAVLRVCLMLSRSSRPEA